MSVPTMSEKFNVLDHRFVPRHEVIPKKEVNDLLKKFSIGPDQLPRILVTDPGALAIGARPGDVVKITRESLVAGEAIAFRLCVES